MQNSREKPEIRFDEYMDKWCRHQFLDIVSRITNTSADPEYERVEYEDIIPEIGLLNKDDNKGKSNKTGIVFMPGDILYGKLRPYLKNWFLSNMYGVAVGDFWVLRPNKHDSKFVYNLIQTKAFQNVANQSTGTKMPRADWKLVSKNLFYIPEDTSEEEKIGEFICSLNDIINSQQNKYFQLVNMKQTLLEKMFPRDGEKVPEIRFDGFEDDWVSCRLEEIVKQHNAGIYISKKNYGEGINIIGVGDIYDSDTIDGEIYRLAPVNDKRFILEENDLIYGESSLVPEGIARTMCVTEKGAGTAFAWHTRRLKIDNSILNSHFLTLELNYNRQVRNYLMNVSTQTALTGMTTDAYFGASIIFPTLKEQERISKTFLELDNLISLQQRKIDQLKNIKHSFLDKMFVS